MLKQIIFAHSGGSQTLPGQGSYDFVEWLKQSLEAEYDICHPIIEDPEAPAYSMWKAVFNQEFANPEGEVILIGHSLGGSILLKYLSEEKTSLRIKGLFLVSIPFWGQDQWNVDDFSLIPDFQSHLPELPVIHLYHCLDDPVVPFEHMELYQNKIPGAVIHELNGNNHAFSNGLPIIIEHIKRLEHPVT